MRVSFACQQEDAKETLKKMTHPFNKEKKAADTAHAEAAKEHHTHERQEKNALHTERGQEARQVNFALQFCH
jgi:histidinol-phosphate/aromatic aminotransferase/cobyric acid decarboxylase-like protein